MENLELGAFSISLAVKDIVASKEFYEKLGFIECLGDISANWLILRSGAVTIGLFQGMFDSNILTFNPGWDNDATPLSSFTDIREIKQTLVNRGIMSDGEFTQSPDGPASFTLVDPDGNTILIDQHV